jgi:Tfp pilus assembly protein PilN
MSAPTIDTPADVEPTTPLALLAPTGFRVARVNLLPPEIEQARRLRRTQRALAGGLLGLVAVLGGGYAFEVHGRHSAEQELADVKARTTVLQNEQARYADVPRTVAAIDAAEAARQAAMAGDVEWARTLTDFSLSLPAEVRFTSLTLNVAGTATTGTAGTTATGSTGATGSSTAAGATATGTAGIGTVTVEGNARTQRDVATWLDTLSRRPGMTGAAFTSAQKQKVGSRTIVKFSSTATLTADALSHRYDRKQG